MKRFLFHWSDSGRLTGTRMLKKGENYNRPHCVLKAKTKKDALEIMRKLNEDVWIGPQSMPYKKLREYGFEFAEF